MLEVKTKTGIFNSNIRQDQRQDCCHCNSTTGVSLFLSLCTLLALTKFEKHCFNIFRDILDSVFYHLSCTVYYVITFLISIIKKTLISLEPKKIFQKGKRHSPVSWKVFQITSNYFSFHRHLNQSKHVKLLLHFLVAYCSTIVLIIANMAMIQSFILNGNDKMLNKWYFPIVCWN